MSGEIKSADETFTLSGTAYDFILARPGTLSNASSSPFAPKSVFGDRSYGDYDAISAIAMSDFSGGCGQDRFSDATMYLDAEYIDTRGGSLTLGPLALAVSTAFSPNVTGESWYDIWADPAVSPQDQITRIANKYTTPVAASGVISLRGVWVFLRADDWVDTVYVKLYDHDTVNNLPQNELLSASVAPGTISGTGKWTWVPFSPAHEVTSNATYWISVENTSATKAIYWLHDADDLDAVAKYLAAGWTALDGETDGSCAFWADDYTLRPTAPPTVFLGTGADGIARVWLRASASLYYLGSTPTVTPVKATAGGATKLLAAAILATAWFRAPADTASWLYCAIGDDNDMERFNASIGAESWETQTGHKARCLCNHDKYLVYAYDRNKVDCFDGTNWGDGAGTSYVEVGDRNYVVRNMVSWNGAVWLGKDDGLYKLTIPTGYPTGVVLTCQKMVDFLPLADSDNFALMLVHKGDLYFNIQSGLMQYTLSVGSSASVLNSIAPDTGLNISSAERQTFKAGVSILGALWLLAEGTVTPGATSESVVVGNSRLYCYTEGKWYPITEFEGVQLMPMRGIVVEPGWYGEHPRLWFNQGWLASYLEMPTNTLKRWLVPDVEFYSTGYWYSSWFDGNIRTVEKDWLRVELVISNSGRGNAAGTTDTVVVCWRPDEDTAWAQLERDGAAATLAYDADNTYVEFPVDSHSHKCQLRVQLHGMGTQLHPWGTTPRIEAIVLKYMERPDDIRTHTRTYVLADRGETRTGAPVKRSLAEQLDDLRTLREAKEPLSWRSWYGKTRNVHIVDYSTSERPDEERDTGDKGAVYAVVRLQEVD